MNKNYLWCLVLVIPVLLILPGIEAGVPSTMSYQGKLTDSSGEPLEGNYNLTFKIYSAQSGGSLRWSETHPGVPVTGGLFSVLLGSQGSSLTQTVFSISSTWLQVEVNGEVMGPRSPLTSVGYAHRIATIAGATGGAVTGTVSFIGDVQVAGIFAPAGGIYSQNPISIETIGGHVQITAGSSQITISPTGSVTIQSSDVTISASNDLTLSATGNLSLDAMNIDVHATSALDLRSDMNVNVDAGVNATLDGNSTVTIDGGVTTTIGSGISTIINGGAMVDINGPMVTLN